MPCLITAPRRSDIKETTRQRKTNNKISKNKNFSAKIEYLKLKAPSSDVKTHSNTKLTTQNYFLLTMQQMESFLNETR